MVSPVALTIVGLLYIAAAFDMYMHDKGGWTVAFVCYAIANYGILWEAMK